MDVFLASNIADDSARTCFLRESLHQPCPPRNERDASAARREIADQRQSEA